MYDSAIPTSRIITVSLWSVTFLILAVAFVIAIAVSPLWGLLIGNVACCLSAVAAVSQIRCIALRSVRFIAQTTTLDREPPERTLHGI